MADVELLPLVGTLRALPEHVQGVVRAYARANVDHATASKDAEIKALLEELDAMEAENEWMLAERDALTAEVERLRSERVLWRDEG